MNNVMLDLETMGKGPNAAIIAIGAVAFNVEKEKIGDSFYTIVDLESAVEAGGVIDASTVLWWLKQNEGARAEFAKNGEPIAVALHRFSIWFASLGEDICVWGNGASFDNVILASAYRHNNTTQPWKYYNDRCYRTIKNLIPSVKIQQVGEKHNAVNDAESQALHLIKIAHIFPDFLKWDKP